MKEEWRDVVGFEEYFQVSNFGNVYSKRSAKLLKQHTNRYGYKVIATKIGGRLGKCYCLKVHRLVAEAFLGTPSTFHLGEASKTSYGKVLVNHIDSDRQNNNLANLEWCTAKENYLHTEKSSEHMTSFRERFTKNWKDKYLAEFGIDKLKLICASTVDFGSDRKLAKQFNISRNNVKTILKYKEYWLSL